MRNVIRDLRWLLKTDAVTASRAAENLLRMEAAAAVVDAMHAYSIRQSKRKLEAVRRELRKKR